MGRLENTKSDQLIAAYYNRMLIERINNPFLSSVAFLGNYEGRWFWRKICWLIKHKWTDITDKSVKSAKQCDRCKARFIERKQISKITFKRYNHGTN